MDIKRVVVGWGVARGGRGGGSEGGQMIEIQSLSELLRIL